MAKTLEISISKYDEVIIVADLSKVDPVDPVANYMYKVEHREYTPGCDLFDLVSDIFQHVDSIEYKSESGSYGRNQSYTAEFVIEGESLYVNATSRWLGFMTRKNGKFDYITSVNSKCPFNNFSQFKLLYGALFGERGVKLKLTEFVSDRLGLEIESCYVDNDWSGTPFFYVKPVESYGMKFVLNNKDLKFVGYAYEDSEGYQYTETIESLEQELVSIQKKIDTMRKQKEMLGDAERLKEIFDNYVQEAKNK